MEVESSTYTDFISCDRAGRRNAVHDIQRDANTISMRKLTKDIGELGVEGAGEGLQALGWLRTPRLGGHSLKLQQSKVPGSQVWWETPGRIFCNQRHGPST